MARHLKLAPCPKSKRRDTIYPGPGRKATAHALALLNLLFLMLWAVACGSSSSDKTDNVDKR